MHQTLCLCGTVLRDAFKMGVEMINRRIKQLGLSKEYRYRYRYCFRRLWHTNKEGRMITSVSAWVIAGTVVRWVSEWASERASEWVSEWVNEWASEWVSEWMRALVRTYQVKTIKPFCSIIVLKWYRVPWTNFILDQTCILSLFLRFSHLFLP